MWSKYEQIYCIPLYVIQARIDLFRTAMCDLNINWSISYRYMWSKHELLYLVPLYVIKTWTDVISTAKCDLNMNKSI